MMTDDCVSASVEFVQKLYKHTQGNTTYRVKSRAGDPKVWQPITTPISFCFYNSIVFSHADRLKTKPLYYLFIIGSDWVRRVYRREFDTASLNTFCTAQTLQLASRWQHTYLGYFGFNKYSRNRRKHPPSFIQSDFYSF